MAHDQQEAASAGCAPPHAWATRASYMRVEARVRRPSKGESSHLFPLGSLLDGDAQGMQVDSVAGDRQSTMMRQTKVRKRKPKPSPSPDAAGKVVNFPLVVVPAVPRDRLVRAGAGFSPRPGASGPATEDMWGECDGGEGESTAPQGDEWSCMACTLLNAPGDSCCQVCSPLPSPNMGDGNASASALSTVRAPRSATRRDSRRSRRRLT